VNICHADTAKHIDVKKNGSNENFKNVKKRKNVTKIEEKQTFINVTKKLYLFLVYSVVQLHA